MIKARYGDKVVLKSGEVGVFAGFAGRGRNLIIVDLEPSANGRPRASFAREDDIIEIISVKKVDE
jgi:hypothetical protein